MTVILAVLCAFGVLFLCWMIIGAFILPVGSAETLRVCVLASGNGESVEHTLKGLDWLRRAGILRAGVDVIDAGLNGAGRAQVTWLCERVYKTVHFRHTHQTSNDPS